MKDSSPADWDYCYALDLVAEQLAAADDRGLDEIVHAHDERATLDADDLWVTFFHDLFTFSRDLRRNQGCWRSGRWALARAYLQARLDPDNAFDILTEATGVRGFVDEEYLPVKYALARLCEERGENERALSLYYDIWSVNTCFRDVAQRIRDHEPPDDGPPPEGAAAMPVPEYLRTRAVGESS